ncbi:MAG: Tm-1-like ATP-binding domain-containing protein, partial [Candidatus Poribacteria bacterium]|nr:Tm-1-like ATP-binding domain-containing protein [Candidatus Poribacteria bacterium]
GDGGPLCDREADGALFDAIKANVREDIPVVELENNINDPEFSAKAVEMMLKLISMKQ